MEPGVSSEGKPQHIQGRHTLRSLSAGAAMLSFRNLASHDPQQVIQIDGLLNEGLGAETLYEVPSLRVGHRRRGRDSDGHVRWLEDRPQGRPRRFVVLDDHDACEPISDAWYWGEELNNRHLG